MSPQTFDFDRFKRSAEEFMMKLSAKLAEAGIPAHTLKCDHICYRVSTTEEYNFYKTSLAMHGELLTESLINGRAISTFRLISTIQTDCHEIPLVELPSPKQGTCYPTGFEHAEFTIDECFTGFRSRYPKLSFVEGHNQILNPELCLKITKDSQAKFHHLPLDRIIEIEKAEISDIIFDFDGTLIKSRETIYEINRIVVSKILGREISLHESISNFHSDFPSLFASFDIVCPKKQSEAIAIWSSIASQFSFELFDGIKEAIEGLKSKGFQIHLWTARDEQSTRKVLLSHRIEHLFTTLSCATGFTSKPNTNSLIFDWKSVGKKKTLVIGDSPSDIIGAKNISAIRAAALWDPHSKKGSLVKSGAELFFYKVSDFTSWLYRQIQFSRPALALLTIHTLMRN